MTISGLKQNLTRLLIHRYKLILNKLCSYQIIDVVYRCLLFLASPRMQQVKEKQTKQSFFSFNYYFAFQLTRLSTYTAETVKCISNFCCINHSPREPRQRGRGEYDFQPGSIYSSAFKGFLKNTGFQKYLFPFVRKYIKLRASYTRLFYYNKFQLDQLK